MSETVESRLAAQGITLPSPAAPVANYVPAVQTGNMLFVSGQIPIGPDGIEYQGKLGDGLSVEEGQAAARLCAINLLAQARQVAGDLERIRCVKLTAFVNSAPDFNDHPKVVNGASDLMVAALGDNGLHSRSAVGVAALPFGVAVEIEAIFEVP